MAQNNFVMRMIDRLFAAGGAMLFMQAPQFIQNYTQILAGHLSELNHQLEQILGHISASGRTVMDLAAKFLKSEDADIVFQGELLQKLVERQAQFAQALQSLTEAGPLSRPFVFIRYMKWTLFEETSERFRPGVPLTLEGLVWGLAGLFIGYSLFRLLARIVKFFTFSKSSLPK